MSTRASWQATGIALTPGWPLLPAACSSRAAPSQRLHGSRQADGQREAGHVEERHRQGDGRQLERAQAAHHGQADQADGEAWVGREVGGVGGGGCTWVGAWADRGTHCPAASLPTARLMQPTPARLVTLMGSARRHRLQAAAASGALGRWGGSMGAAGAAAGRQAGVAGRNRCALQVCSASRRLACEHEACRGQPAEPSRTCRPLPAHPSTARRRPRRPPPRPAAMDW